MANKPAEKYPLNKVNYSVRAAQAVLQYGVGAMVDFKDQTLMTAAPEYWAYDTVTIHDERLEKLLKVSKFGMPTGNDGHRIAYARFPEWYFCPKCRRMKPLQKDETLEAVDGRVQKKSAQRISRPRSLHGKSDALSFL